MPVLLATGNRSALIIPEQARDRAGHIPNAQLAIVPGNHGGFDRNDELNKRIAAFIEAHATADNNRPSIAGRGQPAEDAHRQDRGGRLSR